MIKGKKGGIFGTLIFIVAVFILFTYFFTCQDKVADTFRTKQYCYYFPQGNSGEEKVCPPYKSQYKFNPDNAEWRSYISDYPILVTRINPQTFITNESKEYIFNGNEWVFNNGEYRFDGIKWIENPDKC